VAVSKSRQRFDFHHRSRRASNRPARLVQQSGIDEQRVAAPDPLIERAELIAVKHFQRGKRQHQQIAARWRIELRQRGIPLAEGTRLHA
jgi:hypothetical protein